MGESYQDSANGNDKAEGIVSGLIIVAIFSVMIWLRARVRVKILDNG